MLMISVDERRKEAVEEGVSDQVVKTQSDIGAF